MGNFELSIIPEKMVMTTKKYHHINKMPFSATNFKWQIPLNYVEFRACPKP
jgi:hypothetical protein